MGERSRIHLPSFPGMAGLPGLSRPSVEEARRALGGRASGERTGARVEIDRGRGRVVEGLVVLSSPTEEDVWIGEGLFARLKAPERARPLGRPSPALDAVAADLARFARLCVGDRVEVRHAGRLVTGVVLELCRYGALLDLEGRVLAVGFRALGACEVKV